MEENIKRKLFIESYGCAMNFADSEVVASIMAEVGVETTNDEMEADIIFINTCSIRDNAEQKIRHRLKHLRHNKKQNKNLTIGVLGCMAERLKKQLLEEEKLVDIVAGPDAYKELPILLKEVESGHKAINVMLSLEETYAEIQPTRLNSNGVTAFISITRGCDNMCSFCVVPFTRGRERSRNPESIVAEAQDLVSKGYKEVTLLGQNVDSYLWYGGGARKDFNKLTEEEQDISVSFANLLEMVAQVDPNLRVRFSTSHPKDIHDEVLFVMKKYVNVAKHIHLPAQSGSTRILEKMNRTYTREWYEMKYNRIKEILPECSVSSDIITGFCSETEEDHHATLDLMKKCEYEFSYMYFYSERPGTLAARKFEDDIPEVIKKRRLTEVIEVQHEVAKRRNKAQEGKIHRVLIEMQSKKNADEWMGRNEQNIKIIFPKADYKMGDYVDVRIERSTITSLIGVGV
ncbi:tRNA (N6-isopentenyl adenosine(37)-C2)-methylthiotransferase MiaB [Bacteroidia bacterium]|nr:tRNA (N6-isopentenyl adenosine(37)-C2)-methylthiotransferase MiaB [Bacteroidia bacterium]MDB9881741.1 tRNA (N6-isopentenyl adenosine(37)-C2)-methylthiotransferase MiaB [Bacteroidia bacterium]